MGAGRAGLLLLVTVGCAPGDPTPYWAVDPIVVYPDGAGITGIQAWTLYAEPWGRRFAPRHYVCGIVVALEGSPVAACEGCVETWQVETEVVDSDCADEVQDDPHFVALTGVALTEALPVVDGSPPHDDPPYGVTVRYEVDWLPFGWAYPEALDHRMEPSSMVWDDEEPFALAPAFAWELTP